MLALSLKWARIGHELYFVDQDKESVLVFDWYIVQRHNILLELQKKCDKFESFYIYGHNILVFSLQKCFE